MPRKPLDTVQLKLRFPERLRARIEAAAKKSDRSLNGEIVHRLEQSFERDDTAALIRETAQATATATTTMIISHFPSPHEFLAGGPRQISPPEIDLEKPPSEDPKGKKP